ncbi:MAG TPA: hypothetical protein VK790_10145 [Solirubrobacteraceae bacterium]|nr:hypothetical protein [Solirubrobacteraceae bacterium]
MAVAQAAAASSFPGTESLDTFEGPAENPLSDGGKFSKLAWATSIGRVFGEGFGWAPKEGGEEATEANADGAYWNAKEYSDPAVSVHMYAENLKNYAALWADTTGTGSKNGYRLRIVGLGKTNYAFKLVLEKWVSGTQTVLGESGEVLFKGLTHENVVGITAVSGKVAAWYGTSELGLATEVEASDSTFSKGYVGIEGTNENAYGETRLRASTALPIEPLEAPKITLETPDQAVPETVTTGSWEHEPTEFKYEWKRCTPKSEICETIGGATSSKYTPVEADVGKTLFVKVCAINGSSEACESSAKTGTVKPIGEITEYELPEKSEANGITEGPEKEDLWFVDEGTSKIGKITTSGTITEYSLPAGSKPTSITDGPEKEKALWFTEKKANKIGKITTSGTITEYSLTKGSEPDAITAGPDGNLWFADWGSKKVGKITPAGEHKITEYALGKEVYPTAITVGPDGNLWFTSWGGGTSVVGKVTTSGTITEYALPKGSGGEGITEGPEKEDLWFTEENSSKIGKITTTGSITEYSISGLQPCGITVAPDGNLWFGVNENAIGRITTAGTVTEYKPHLKEGPLQVAVGPDNNVWFTEGFANRIGKITP